VYDKRSYQLGSLMYMYR